MNYFDKTGTIISEGDIIKYEEYHELFTTRQIHKVVKQNGNLFSEVVKSAPNWEMDCSGNLVELKYFVTTTGDELGILSDFLVIGTVLSTEITTQYTREQFSDIPKDSSPEIGEEWYVKLTDSSELLHAQIVSKTNKTVVIKAFYDSLDHYHPEQRFKHTDVEFVEKIK